MHSHAERGNEVGGAWERGWPSVGTRLVGRKEGTMGRSRYKFVEGKKPHFVTCTTVGWVPLFGSPAIVKILFDSLRYLQKENRLTIYAYVVMENHTHFIASSDQLSKEIGDFKSYTARQTVDFLKKKNASNVLRQLKFFKSRHKVDREYQVWQEGSHPKVIQSEETMLQKIEYIHNNPVKRGFVDNPTHWRYSSARNYFGLEGLLEISRF